MQKNSSHTNPTRFSGHITRKMAMYSRVVRDANIQIE